MDKTVETMGTIFPKELILEPPVKKQYKTWKGSQLPRKDWLKRKRKIKMRKQARRKNR